MYSPGNILSIVVFFIWIPIAIWGAHRWPPAKATALLLLGGVLFLPELVYFKAPGLPHFKKLEIAIFVFLVGVVLFHRERLKQVQLSRSIKLLIFLLLGGMVMTVLLNSDPISYGVVYIPGHRPYDAFHVVVRKTLTYVLPFVFGVAMFRDARDLRVLFRILVGAAVVYSIFQIIELLLSPQMNAWVYGYYQHSFYQTMRGGGYRPMVFMSHGLALAIFGVSALVAAAAMYKAKIKVFGVSPSWATGYLWLILVLGKSTGAILYSMVAVPLVLFASPKNQVRVAIVIALFVFLYPAARGADLVPVDKINEIITEQYGEQRASSMMTRFVNEAMALEDARKRIVFGWGSHCRGCRFHPEQGHMLSIRDGDWINTIADFGLVGFVGKFGLLLLPVFFVARRLKYVPRESDRRLLAAMAVIVAISAFDLIPNGNYNYLVLLFSGALYGSTLGILREVVLRRRKKRVDRMTALGASQEPQASA